MKGIRLTHQEIAEILNTSRETVRRIERRAMLKLRRAAGSTYRGGYDIRDNEGVAEPTWDSREYSKAAAKAWKTRRGG